MKIYLIWYLLNIGYGHILLRVLSIAQLKYDKNNN